MNSENQAKQTIAAAQVACGRTIGVLHPFHDDVFHLAPIPIVYHENQRPDLEQHHQSLMEAARTAFSNAILEVPDERHIQDLGDVPTFSDGIWSEDQIPAVGVWHRVPTNSFLNLTNPSVKELRGLIEDRYLNAIRTVNGTAARSAFISESWIQFYKDGDRKVLHNHERYGPPYPNDRWAGAYYIDDGEPDPSMPYSGVFSFRIRLTNYFIRPSPGLLLIWPADVLHEVHPFYGGRERIVVNFNINTSPI